MSVVTFALADKDPLEDGETGGGSESSTASGAMTRSCSLGDGDMIGTDC